MSEKQYCVYILTNINHTVLYTGVTNNLQRRMFECGCDVETAIYREIQIKAGSRKKKIALVNRFNPEWRDLYLEYFGETA